MFLDFRVKPLLDDKVEVKKFETGWKYRGVCGRLAYFKARVTRDVEIV